MGSKAVISEEDLNYLEQYISRYEVVGINLKEGTDGKEFFKEYKDYCQDASVQDIANGFTEAIYEDMSKFEQKYGMTAREKVIDECGDVLWQFVNLLNQYDISLTELMELNHNKLINRHNGNKIAKDGGKR